MVATMSIPEGRPLGVDASPGISEEGVDLGLVRRELGYSTGTEGSARASRKVYIRIRDGWSNWKLLIPKDVFGETLTRAYTSYPRSGNRLSCPE